ncbi:MAG: hypothetical protein GWN01_02190 [Nitrosopumilaceae archaeon]|nr:hypothetical protein [Nitrosopumilaceae archaeon]NIX60386.1 hypothetical protein [Nitrosopumilaceae archaeon]
MYSTWGQFMWADTFGANRYGGKLIVCIGDKSTHGGTVILTNQVDDKLTCKDELVAVESAPEGVLQHLCPITGHGTYTGSGWVTPITAVTVKSFHNGKLILTELAFSGCGARLAPPNRRCTVE